MDQKSETEPSKKFDLQEVEVWVMLASLMGALLALLGFQMCRLCKTSRHRRLDSQRQMIENVIEEGLDAATKTKKVVTMNIHLVPYDSHVHQKFPPPPSSMMLNMDKWNKSCHRSTTINV